MEDGAHWAGDACPCAYAFTKPGQIKAWLDQHPKGIEIQDLSSQQVARVCDPQPGQIWWDACAGSGGKGLHLLDLADRNLDLTCTDKRESAVENLVKRARAHGLGKIRHYTLDLTKTDIQFPNLTFDGILVDAPCTGTGTWSRNPDAAWRTEEKDIRQAARRQTSILENLSGAVPSGSVLVYAVCSLTRSETIEVVQGFLASHSDFSLKPFAHPLTGEATDGTLTLLPSETNADGMYVARFCKK
jgi:16S rRNA (cytosine967-C5)-methyltransferase